MKKRVTGTQRRKRPLRRHRLAGRRKTKPRAARTPHARVAPYAPRTDGASLHHPRQKQVRDPCDRPRPPKRETEKERATGRRARSLRSRWPFPPQPNPTACSSPRRLSPMATEVLTKQEKHAGDQRYGGITYSTRDALCVNGAGRSPPDKREKKKLIFPAHTPSFSPGGAPDDQVKGETAHARPHPRHTHHFHPRRPTSGGPGPSGRGEQRARPGRQYPLLRFAPQCLRESATFLCALRKGALGCSPRRLLPGRRPSTVGVFLGVGRAGWGERGRS